MRKQNSDFQTAFLSEAGSKLKNSDYFGFVELDQYACYVIADGITDLPGTESAKLAIETVIREFESSPSMSKRAVRRMLQAANKALVGRNSYTRQEASLTVIVTDYLRIRYGYLGNTRLRMYRGGNVFLETRDMSYAQELAEREQIAKDVLQKHEERNNLYSYLGSANARPYISKKIKLADTDIITLYTRGIWENVDEAELDEVFAEADNVVQNSLDNVEDLLLSRQPENLENYTLAAIFINKVYSDPQRAKKIKKIILLSVIITVVILVIIGLCVFFHWRKQQRIEDMNYYFTNTVEYINTGNFIRAKEECQKAQELAEKVKDKNMKKRLQEYLFVVETVILADEKNSAGEYEAAEEYYLGAMDRARYADMVGTGYMSRKLDQIAGYLSVMDYIALGDSLLEKGEYGRAEGKYLEAKKLSVDNYYTEGKEAAMKALENLYTKWAEAEAEQKQAAGEQAEKTVTAAELIVNGDKACMEQDFVGAEVYYTMALTKYQEIGDATNEQYVQQKLDSLAGKIAEQEEKRQTAQELEQQGAKLRDAGDYWGAKSQYLQAKGIYLELASDTDVERVSNIIAQLDAMIEM